MAEMETKAFKIKEKRGVPASSERTRPGPTFTPAVDIFETDREITLARVISRSVSKISTAGVNVGPGLVLSEDAGTPLFSFILKAFVSISAMFLPLQNDLCFHQVLTVICLGFAASDLGNTTVKTPSVQRASTLEVSICPGKLIILLNFPASRSLLW